MICYLFFQASTGVDAFFDRQALPDINTQYTAHNITVLVQTVCRGLVYLITFIFGANAVGLAGQLHASCCMRFVLNTHGLQLSPVVLPRVALVPSLPS